MTLALLAAALIAATPISLEAVRRQSRENAPAHLAELERLRAAEQIRLSRADVLPKVSVGAGTFAVYDTRDLAQTLGSFSLSATVSQLVYDGGRWWNRIAQSNALADAQADQAAEQRLASDLEGVRRFYDLYFAQETLRVLEAHTHRSEEQLARARGLFEGGRGQKTDVYAAEVNLANDRLGVERQRARIASAQGSLAVWLAHPGAEELVAEAPPDLRSSAPQPEGGIAPPSVEEALTVARQSRPLLRVIAARLRASERGVEVASGTHWPAISALVSGARQSLAVRPFFTDYARQNYAYAGLSLEWDLYDGGETSARVQQAELARQRAEIERRQAERELEAEVRDSIVQLQSQLEMSRIARANLEAARSGLALAEGRFREGVGSTLEVRDAQLKLTQAELSLLESRVGVEVARVAVARALGTEAK